MHAYAENASSWPSAALALTVALCAGLIAGCDDRETQVRSYPAPKDPTPPPSTAPTTTQPPSSQAAATPAASLPLQWTLPAGWKHDPTPRPMRVATVNVDSNGQRAELIVTRFRAGGFGGLLENLNRWRQQVGLDPLTDENDAKPEKTTVGGADGRVYDFTGPASSDGNPPRRNRVVMVETSGGDAWFFRFFGPADLIESQRGAFDSLLQSVKFEG